MPSLRTITITLLMLLTLGALAGFRMTQQPTLKQLSTQSQPKQITTTDVIYVIRHADTQAGNNPDLSPIGQARAASLASMLQDENLAAVFVTNTNRSIQTGTPAANDADISTTIYNPFDAAGVAESITNLPGSNATLVVAHSNTVPLIITALGGPLFDDLEETEFDRLYAVTLSNGQHIRTLELHYE